MYLKHEPRICPAAWAEHHYSHWLVFVLKLLSMNQIKIIFQFSTHLFYLNHQAIFYDTQGPWPEKPLLWLQFDLQLIYSFRGAAVPSESKKEKADSD